MQPNISEFSYGYAITDELIHWHGTAVTAAPVFPSLQQEGKTGGGYDVLLQQPGIMLFLQFKLSHCMVRSNSKECVTGMLSPPYFRMHIRPSRSSNQHEMLLDLEEAGNCVYYVAPVFHQPWELNHAYLNHEATSRSIWIKPSWVGALPDDADHYVAFRHPSEQAHFCSEPRRLNDNADFAGFRETVLAALRDRGTVGLETERLSQLAEKMTEISQKRRDFPVDFREQTRKQMQIKEPIEQVAFYSQMFFEAQAFIVHGETE